MGDVGNSGCGRGGLMVEQLPTPEARLHILLIGAQIDVLNTLVQAFGTKTIYVELAGDLVEAITLCRVGTLQLVILELPPNGSSTGVRQLRAAAGAVPILTIGRNDQDRAGWESLRVGADAYCSAPLRLDVLERFVEGVRRGAG